MHLYPTRIKGLRWKLIRDPIYNYIFFSKEVEGRLLDTLYLQRLRRIRQLQVAYLVYPGADHSRFQHSLGTMHLSGLFAEQLLSVLEEYEDLEGYDKSELVEATRIAGLVHDLGHGPYSHAFEEAILFRSKELSKKELGNHELVGLALMRTEGFKNVIEECSSKANLEGLCDLVDKIMDDKKPADRIISLLRKTIKAWIYPADIMDFLMRDSYYTGTREYGTIDYYRLITYSYPYEDLIVLDRNALYSLRSFLQSRYYMFETVYLHKVCRSFDYMVQLMMKEASEYLELESRVLSILEGKPEAFLELDDFNVLYMINKIPSKDAKAERAKYYLKCLLERINLWKPVGQPIEITFPLDAMGHFMFKYGDIEKAARDIKDKVIEYMVKNDALKVYADDIWVDHNLKRTLPALPYPLETLRLAKLEEGVSIVSKVEVPKLLEESGLSPRVTFTLYVPSKLVKDTSLRVLMENIVDKVYSETFSVTKAITM